MRAVGVLVAVTAIPVAIAFWRQFGGFPAIDTVRAAAVLVALVMLVGYGLCFLIAPAREFFELTPLPLSDVALIAVVAGLWAVVVILFWRVRMFDRVALTWRRATG